MYTSVFTPNATSNLRAFFRWTSGWDLPSLVFGRNSARRRTNLGQQMVPTSGRSNDIMPHEYGSLSVDLMVRGDIGAVLHIT